MIYNIVNMKQLAIIILVISNIILLYPVKLNWGIDLVWETFFSMDFWYGRCLSYFSLVLMSFILMLKYKDTPKLFFFLIAGIYTICISLICWIGNPLHFIPYLLSTSFTSGKYERQIIILFDVFLSIGISVFFLKIFISYYSRK